MDPASILSIIGAALSVANGVTRAIKTLSELKSHYSSAPLQLSTLVGQLYIVQAALEEISAWTRTSKDILSGPRYQQLAAQIGTSLDSFRPLILALQHLDELDSQQKVAMTAMKKVSFLWSEQDLTMYSGLLDRQVNALNLFLQAIRCKTFTDQRRLVDDEDSQIILQRAKSSSASIRGISDGMSILSECTNANTVSLDFEFDAVLLGSQAYKSAHRSNLRNMITMANAPRPESSSLPNTFQHPMQLIQNPVKELSSFFDSSEGDILLVTEADMPDIQNESLSSRADQNADRIDQTPMTGNLRLGGSESPPHKPHDSPVAEQQQGLALATAAEEIGVVSSSPKLPTARSSATLSIASSVASISRLPTSLSEKVFVISKSTLLHLLKGPWRARATDPSVNGSTTRSLEGFKQQLVPTHSTGTQFDDRGRKILLLGMSGSGKSTLLKNINIHLHGRYTPEESMCFTEIIQTNIVQAIRVILDKMESSETPLQHRANEDHANTIFKYTGGHDDNYTELAAAVTALWADAGVQKVYRRRHRYCMMENVSHFANHIKRLAHPNYVPSQEDILKSWIKTTGITETKLPMDSVTLRVFDFGGRRSERKKWIKAFESVDSIIFTVDTSAYCRLLFEDATVNGMQEQLTLWDSISSASRWFTKTDFLLVFTKVDCLPETIQLCPISSCFPDFEAPNSLNGMTEHVESYLAYLEERFMALPSEQTRQRIKVVFADLVHVDEINPAGIVLETLKSYHHERTRNRDFDNARTEI